MLKPLFISLLLFFVSPAVAFAADLKSLGNVILVSDNDVQPRHISLTSEELMVFILNKSRNNLVTFEVDFGKQEVHCSNDNVEAAGDGVLRSVVPIVPSDFTALCFHGVGSYPVKVYGINGKKDPINVIVELKASAEG